MDPVEIPGQALRIYGDEVSPPIIRLEDFDGHVPRRFVYDADSGFDLSFAITKDGENTPAVLITRARFAWLLSWGQAAMILHNRIGTQQTGIVDIDEAAVKLDATLVGWHPGYLGEFDSLP